MTRLIADAGPKIARRGNVLQQGAPLDAVRGRSRCRRQAALVHSGLIVELALLKTMYRR